MTKIFCAIDTPDLSRATALAIGLADTGCGIKLGLEFFTAHGPAGVAGVRQALADAPLFLDLKLHDIPNTVAGAVRAAMRCRADFLTLHASGGLQMMTDAVRAARDEEEKTGYAAPALLGVTVLTSLDDTALSAVGQETPAAAQVERLARLAAAAGLNGIVCSPHEIARVKACAPGLIRVVPGIRPAGSDTGDQKRVMTPQEAASAGADWLVIGRPITSAPDPARAAREILAGLAEGGSR